MAFNPNDFVNKSTSCINNCFAVVDGKVNVEFAGYEHTFKVMPDLFLLPAFQDDNGEFFHLMSGQSQEYLVTHILENVMTEEKFNSRYATCIFLEEIEEAATKGEQYVKTICGWYFLDWKKEKKAKEFKKTFVYSR